MTIKDKDIWALYTRSLAPLGHKARSRTRKPTVKKNPDKNTARQMAEKEPVWAMPVAPPPPLPDIALERKREKAIRQGEISIDAKIDLHGMTQLQAHDALTGFMARAAKNGKRHLLIITGKGKGGTGVLRTKLRDWLATLPQAASILAIRPASVKHGGDGAFYVVLRKKN